MGEVYRARDASLGRDVAIKILPEAFTSDPERLARFEREARILAACARARTRRRGDAGGETGFKL
jgi:serine/threonine protein kinase